MTTEPKGRPKAASTLAEKEMDRLDENFKQFDENVKKLAEDSMTATKKEDVEPQTKLSQKEIERAPGIWLKPAKSLATGQKFNEKWRKDYEYMYEYVNFIAEHREIIGETIETWTKRFPGTNCDFWLVPTNKPVWAPRIVAEQIKRSSYVRIVMKEASRRSEDSMGTYYGELAADTVVQRLDAMPIVARKSIFMGTSGF
jgi:hypothetical protein